MSDREDRALVSKLWFLVEWDVQEGPSTYSVVSWSSLIGPPPRQKLCTGKTILVRRGKQANPANIVIMSEDKRFLDTELHQLRNIAAANLQTKNEIGRKRRKLHITADSPSDATSSTSSRHCSPSPTPSNHFSLQDRYNNTAAPPMTFDQQTQTESKILNNNGSSENVIVDHSLLDGIRQNQTIMREDLLELMRVMENMQNSLAQMISSQSDTSRRNKTLSPTLSSTSTPFRTKSTIKNVKSPISKPPTENSSPVDSDPEYEPEPSEYKCTPLGSSQKMNMTFNGFPTNMYNQTQKPWESEIYPNDMVPIGPGRTLIPLHVMNQINWSSHSNATRRLMMAVFNRHTLATHTLTGKASPAFNGVMSKPQKMRLDPGKIMDIIETVSKYCGVKEGAVRSAITTKCADENKMLRARMVKEEKTNDENKENGDANMCDNEFDLK